VTGTGPAALWPGQMTEVLREHHNRPPACPPHRGNEGAAYGYLACNRRFSSSRLPSLARSAITNRSL
jgi:hypothetical protein